MEENKTATPENSFLKVIENISENYVVLGYLKNAKITNEKLEESIALIKDAFNDPESREKIYVSLDKFKEKYKELNK